MRDVGTKTDGFDELFENIEEIGVGLDESGEVIRRLGKHLDDESERTELMLKSSYDILASMTEHLHEVGRELFVGD